MGFEIKPDRMKKISPGGLQGLKIGNFIYIAGPCGGQHAMSMDEARILRNWLDEALGDVINDGPS